MERKQADAEQTASAAAPKPRFVVRYETSEALLDAFERELLHGVVFVHTTDAIEAGVSVRVVLDLAFCRRRLELGSSVVAPSPEPLEAPSPGVSLCIDGPPAELRRRLVEATGVFLPEPDPTPPGKTIRAPRFDAITEVDFELDGRRYVGETANVSYNGMLALCPGADFPNGSRLRVRIQPAGDGETLELTGQVANQMPCESGVRALGVQFLYELDRFEEVSRFVDTLRSVHHARSLARVRGSLRDAPLETVLETAAAASGEGTLILRREGEQGRISYRDGAIVAAVAGLESGERAIARMFCWNDASFELHPEVLPMDVPTTPLPLDSAILRASVERDELARLDLGRLGPETVFDVDEKRLAALETGLDEQTRDLVANAAMGFPVSTLVDMASASDTLVYKAIAELVDAGVLRLSADANA